MTTIGRIAALATGLLSALSAGAVELKVSREALQRTLQQQLFSAPNGRYYLKGSATSGCFVYAEDPDVRFEKDRIVVRLKTQGRHQRSRILRRDLPGPDLGSFIGA